MTVKNLTADLQLLSPAARPPHGVCDNAATLRPPAFVFFKNQRLFHNLGVAIPPIFMLV